MRVLAPCGRKWRVGRRWLAWRPHTPQALSFLMSAAVGLSVLDILFPLVAIALVLASPLLVVFLLNWAAALVATPFALALRATGRPWTVVARSDRAFAGTAPGFAAAGQLADRVRTEISGTGSPSSLRESSRTGWPRAVGLGAS